MLKSILLKYKFQLIILILIFIGVIIFDFSNFVELSLILIPLFVMIYILGVREFLKGMNFLLSFIISSIILLKFEIRGWKFLLFFIVLFLIISIFLTILLKVYDKNYSFKTEDFYNPILSLYGFTKLGLVGILYLSVFLLAVVSLSIFGDKFFGENFNGNYCAKILIIDPNGIEEKRELPIRINIEVKDNILVGYRFKDSITKYDSILLNEYNLINRDASNSNKFNDDSVCMWFSKSNKNIIGIKIRYEGYCDN